jgi:GAF domain-containing protein
MVTKKERYDSLLEEVNDLFSQQGSRDEKLTRLCGFLKSKIDGYDWVGFYFVSRAFELSLGPYAGAPTEHTVIPFGRGICGRVAETEQTYISYDVSKEPNYLSCSDEVKSEIVVPIFKDGEFIGQLDIDSHRIAAFTIDDQHFLEDVCKKVEGLF